MKKKILIITSIFILLTVISIFTYKYFSNNKNEIEYYDYVEEDLNDIPNEIITKYGIIINKNNNILTILNNDEIFEDIDIGYEYTESIIGDAIKINIENDIYTINSLNIDDDEYFNVFNNKGIFNEYYQEAFNKLKTLSLEEKIGQMLFVRIPSYNQINDLKKYHFGGYILFGRDTQYETKQSLTNKIKSYQDNSSIPLLIATDEEGGIVARVSTNRNIRSSTFKSPQRLYREGGWDAIRDNTIEMSNLLGSLGINVNFAPVADISTNPRDYIYSRTIGQDKYGTSEFVSTVINESKNYSVSYTMKHFPGYGNNKDTHTGIAIDTRDINSIINNDLEPFKAGIREFGEAIMVSHNIIKNLDSNYPASLSYKAHNLARKNLKYKGILMTDDLDMDAITLYSNSPFKTALLAGNDMLLISEYEKAFNTFINEINNNTLDEDIINHAAFKVLSWKYYKGLIQEQ